MALEAQSTAVVVALPNGDNGGDNGKQAGGDGGDDGGRLPRLPRWTRQEILVLIQGKRVAESRVRRGGGGGGVGQLEKKWETISSYCKRHGANRGAVQCRKRWSNLAGDYRKIKEWELKEEKGGEGWQSFWVMRNDLRRERKLPGFFDKEVYDILDGVAVPPEMVPIAKVDYQEAVFDSGRSAAETDGLFSDNDISRPVEMEEEEEESSEKATATATAATMEDSPSETVPAPTPISEKRYQPFGGGGYYGQANEGQPTPNTEKIFAMNEGRKRRRSSSDNDNNDLSLQDQLIQILERNNRMLTAHLEAQNINNQLDRDQRKEQADGLITVLNKLADAMGRIADKM
ncbi:hypothetical protein Sjap_023181 [Stephania japonica]|uniref:Myb-like domain-containing protein n=1 Tax=Stephania japonica TaxID=461633 RepID=A0AAP0EB67_9MAGN